MTTTGNKTIVGDLEVLGANMGDPRMRNLIMYSRLGAQARLPGFSGLIRWVLRRFNGHPTVACPQGRPEVHGVGSNEPPPSFTHSESDR